MILLVSGLGFQDVIIPVIRDVLSPIRELLFSHEMCVTQLPLKCSHTMVITGCDCFIDSKIEYCFPMEACMAHSGTMKASPCGEGIYVRSNSKFSKPCF